MAWDLGSWLVVVRCLQVLGMVVSGSLNGFLVAYLTLRRLGASQTIVCLEWIVRSFFRLDLQWCCRLRLVDTSPSCFPV